MALTPSEERAMREIERELEANDPRFVERLRGAAQSRHPHWVLGTVILAVGISFAAAGRGQPGPQLFGAISFLTAGWFFGRSGWSGLLVTAVRLRARARRLWNATVAHLHRMRRPKWLALPHWRLRRGRRRGHGRRKGRECR